LAGGKNQGRENTISCPQLQRLEAVTGPRAIFNIEKAGGVQQSDCVDATSSLFFNPRGRKLLRSPTWKKSVRRPHLTSRKGLSHKQLVGVVEIFFPRQLVSVLTDRLD
jgi:hypothetical protein